MENQEKITAKFKKNIALIGAGNWGNNHLRELNRLGVLQRVLENSISIIEDRKKDFPDVHFVTDEKQITDDPGIRAVVITTPAEVHYELTKKYLLEGKDVLVEKPLALNVKQAEDLINIAEKNSRILMVGHILQYHPGVIKLKELIDQGDLGQIRYIYSNRLNIGKLRTEENVLWSFAPHDISLIIMFMDGEEPLKVSAFGGAYVNQSISDTTLTILEFKNGIKGHIFVSWLHPFKEQKLVVVGSEKMAVFDDLSKEKLFIYPHKIKWEKGKIPVAQKADFNIVEFEQKQPLKEELLHFIHCIETRKPPKTDAHEGLKVLRILERAEKELKKEGISNNE